MGMMTRRRWLKKKETVETKVELKADEVKEVKKKKKQSKELARDLADGTNG